ncbi:universal stress protein [Dankookia sp. GCM10030260]|uniref:universal stress protein n=1 Tax=Dankookia sp. GCM10030260 TaxID=3273390 RepID=UPI00360A5878
MPLKDILVHLDATPRCATRLQLAVALARQHDAHLIGLHVVDTVLPVMALADGGGGGALLGDLIEQLRQEGLAAAAGVEAEFRETLRREAINGEWRLVEGSLPDTMALHARYADLAVLSQRDPDDAASGAGLAVEQVLFAGGRPVLMVPYAGTFETIGRRVLVGWNASRESARAVADALPILAAAERVTILAVTAAAVATPQGEEPGADIALHLARHGVPATVLHMTAAGLPDAEVLLNQASEQAADLIVVGAYGHSRLREWALGGVTRTLLQSMTVPVLLSH